MQNLSIRNTRHNDDDSIHLLIQMTMDLHAPVSTLMTTRLHVVGPDDKLNAVKAIFDANRIHHVPVVQGPKLVGMISKSDFLHFLRGINASRYDTILEETRLNRYCAEDIMTQKLAKLDPTDRIDVALELFKENLFHALPVVEDDRLVGLLTSFDIIRALADEDGSPEKM